MVVIVHCVSAFIRRALDSTIQHPIGVCADAMHEAIRAAHLLTTRSACDLMRLKKSRAARGSGAAAGGAGPAARRERCCRWLGAIDPVRVRRDWNISFTTKLSLAAVNNTH